MKKTKEAIKSCMAEEVRLHYTAIKNRQAAKRKWRKSVKPRACKGTLVYASPRYYDDLAEALLLLGKGEK